MAVTSLRGMTIPAEGEDLLVSLKSSLESVGSITQAASVESARGVLDEAAAAGMEVSTAHPWYFDVSGVFYKCDGSRNASNTAWVLRPWNEKETLEQTAQIGKKYEVKSAERIDVLVSKLPQRPYDRAVTVFGMLWGDVTGRVNMGVRIGPDHVTAQFSDGKANQTQFAINTGIVVAGVVPDIALELDGGLSGDPGGSIYLSRTDRWNRIVVQAEPITMA